MATIRHLSKAELAALAVELKAPTPIHAATAFEKLVNVYGKSLQDYFKTRLPSWAVKSSIHEPLEQEVWARLWESARSCRFNPGQSTISAYIWGIARHVLAEWWRDLPPLPQPLPPQTPTPSVANRIDLTVCLERLMVADRDAYTVIIAMFFEGFSERQVAANLGIVASTVDDRKKRGLEFLERCFT